MNSASLRERSSRVRAQVLFIIAMLRTRLAAILLALPVGISLYRHAELFRRRLRQLVERLPLFFAAAINPPPPTPAEGQRRQLRRSPDRQPRRDPQAPDSAPPDVVGRRGPSLQLPL